MKRLLIFWLFVSLCAINSITAQQDSILADKILDKLLNSIQKEHKDSIKIYSRQLLKVYSKMDRPDLWMRSQVKVAYCYADRLNRPYDGLQVLSEYKNQLWRAIQSNKEWYGFIQIKMTAGHIALYNIGNVEMATRHYDEAFTLFQNKLNEDDDRIAGYLYHQLGNALTRLGEYEKAENLFARSIDYWHKRHKPEKIRYSDIAIIYNSLSDYSRSLDIIRTGFEFAKDTRGKCHLYTSQISALIALSEDTKAWKSIEKFEKTIAILSREEPEIAYSFQASLSQFKAKLFERKQQKLLAQKAYQQSITYEVKYRGNAQRREVAKFRNSYAHFLLKNNLNEAAMKEFQEMLKAVIPDFQPKNDMEQPAPELLSAENTILEALEGKSLIFEQKGNFAAALQCHELIPIVEQKLRQNYSYEFSSLLALNAARTRFERAVALAWQCYQQYGDATFIHRAFVLTEQARGVLLLQNLQNTRSMLEAAMPEQDRTALLNFRTKSSWLALQLAEAKEKKVGRVTLQSIENELFNLKQQETDFINQLKMRQPAWAAATNEIEFITASNVPKLLRAQQAMLSYFMTENAVFIFTILENGTLHWRREAIDAGFRTQILRLSEQLASGDTHGFQIDSFLLGATALSAILIQKDLPLFQETNALVIIPDDVLVFLPFEILVGTAQGRNTERWRDVDYLIKRFSISYAYSASLLEMQIKLAASLPKSSKYWAGFAPSYFLEPDSSMQAIMATRVRGGAYDLKGIHIEVEKIAKLCGGDKFDGVAATEHVFKKVAHQYQILHLAMHAVPDENAPERSKLLFGDALQNEKYDDNILHANELQVLQLHAALVVLSACHTGFGRINKGEGVYSLARAFAAAGVPATVMSLWRLPDESAPIVMENFYHYLFDGATKDLALRQAKLDFLNTDSLYYYTHPFFWAGLVCNGAPVAVPPPAASKLYYLLAGAAASLLLLFFWLKRK